MISEHEIKAKDFCSSLPAIIGKLDMVYCYDETGLEYELSRDDILDQAIKELRIINDALYGKGGVK